MMYVYRVSEDAWTLDLGNGTLRPEMNQHSSSLIMFDFVNLCDLKDSFMSNVSHGFEDSSLFVASS